MKDMDLALTRLRALIGEQDPDQMGILIHDGEPCASKNAAQRAVLTDRFRGLMRDGLPFRHSVALVGIYFRSTLQRVDVDNLTKFVMDAATHANVWGDDYQVAALAGFLEFDHSRPRTVIALCPYDGALLRPPAFLDCEACGKVFRRDGHAHHDRLQRFCSKRCAKGSIAIPVRTCRQCSTSFKPRYESQRLCSVACANEAKRLQPHACESCGTDRGRLRGRYCKACWLASITKPYPGGKRKRYAEANQPARAVIAVEG